MKLVNLIQETDTDIQEVNPKTAILKLVRNTNLDDAIVKVLNYDVNNLVKGTIKDPITGKFNIINTADDFYEALRVGSISGKDLGKVYTGLLKNPTTPNNVIAKLVTDLVDDATFIKKYSIYTDDKILKSELKKAQYSDQSVKEILKQKNSGKFGVKRTSGGTGGKGGTTTTSTPKVKGGWSTVKDMISKLKLGSSWKQMLLWGTGIGLTAYGLWYLISEYGEGLVPEGMPDEAPSEWSPCVQNLIDSGKGTSKTTPGGLVYVNVIDNSYPKGISFFTNGRIMDVATKRMGRWKCKEGQVELQEKKNKLSMFDIIFEQSNEVSKETMSKYLDDAVDDLDGYVASYNIENLLNIVKNLKGKTYNGEDAFNYFLTIYSEDEGGDSFIDDVNSIGTKTLGLRGIEGKKELIKLISSTPTKTTSGNGLDDIEIVWDGGQPSTPTPTPGLSYFSCEDWDIRTKPYIIGCTSTRIREVQSCLGLSADGKFGPKTEKALMNLESDMSKGITAEIYNKVMRACGRPELDGTQPITTGTTTTTPETTITEPTGQEMATGVTPIEYGETPYTTPQESGEQFYNRLLNGDLLIGSTDKRRIKYKGVALTKDDFDKLTEYLATLGFYPMKVKEKGDENFKYVWRLSRNQ